MISLLIPFILCFTVIASVSLGILAAYIAVFGILSTFRHPAQHEPAPVRPRLVLVPSLLWGTAAFGCPSSEVRLLSANNPRFQLKISLFQFPNAKR